MPDRGCVELRDDRSARVLGQPDHGARTYYVPWLATIRVRMRELRAVQLLWRVTQGFRPTTSPERVGAEPGAPPASTRAAPTEAVVARIFADLQRINDAKQSSLILVYLPTLADYMDTERHLAAWRPYVTGEATRRGYQLVDLVEALRSLHPLRAKTLYLPDTHFSVDGNRYVAELLHRGLRASPSLERKLR